ARMNYYKEVFPREAFGGTPSMVFNGAAGPRGAGPRDNAQRTYEQFHETISDELDQPARASLKLNATRKGDKIDIRAEVADLKETGDSVRLRLVLVEEKVEFKGGNGVGEHFKVVRAFPGGVQGKPLKEKTTKQTASVDLGELRNQLKKYLQDSF